MTRSRNRAIVIFERCVTLSGMDKLLLIDKPSGMTSHDVVDRIRHIFHTRRVGHAGTLDPFATGLLIIGVGTATKKLTALVGLDKTYEAALCLGATSTTFDPEGTIFPLQSPNSSLPTLQDMEHALDQFRGGYLQKAPLFSAKKINGQPLYHLARRGQANEEMRPTKNVTISELTIQNYEWPTLRLVVTSSSGTYIRSLADDIGRVLGCGAYLTELRRIRIGHFSIKDSLKLEELGLDNAPDS